MQTRPIVFAAILLAAAGVYSNRLTMWADSIVSEKRDLIADQRIIQDVNSHSAPEHIHSGNEIGGVIDRLKSRSELYESSTDCADPGRSVPETLVAMRPRTLCRHADLVFLKPVSPLPSYVFRVKTEKGRVVISEVLDGSGDRVESAELYSDPRVSFRLDSAGRVNEQIRQSLILSPEELKSDTVEMLENEEDAKIFAEWNQGTNWLRVLAACWANLSKLAGVGGDNFQGGTGLIEQMSKTAFLDPEDPPPPKTSLTDTEKGDGSVWIGSRAWAKAGSLLHFTRRRLYSAYLAEALTRHFSKEELLMASLNETPYGSEMINVDRGHLNQGSQIKESIWGPKTAARALFNKYLLQLAPM